MKWEGLLNLEFRIQNAEWEEEREKEKGLRTDMPVDNTKEKRKLLIFLEICLLYQPIVV